MTEKPYPHFTRRMYWVGYTGFLICLACFVGIFWDERFFYVFLGAMVLWFAACLLTAANYRCPACMRRLRTLKPKDIDTEWLYDCDRCQVRWKSGYRTTDSMPSPQAEASRRAGARSKSQLDK